MLNTLSVSVRCNTLQFFCIHRQRSKGDNGELDCLATSEMREIYARCSAAQHSAVARHILALRAGVAALYFVGSRI
jgi:hypothetical protein